MNKPIRQQLGLHVVWLIDSSSTNPDRQPVFVSTSGADLGWKRAHGTEFVKMVDAEALKRILQILII